jgi:regulator of replication initiation timing
MDKINIVCSICFEAVSIQITAPESNDDETSTVVPFVKMIRCRHSVCFMCATQLRRGRDITCPLCRETNQKIQIVAFNHNAMSVSNLPVTSLAPAKKATKIKLMSDIKDFFKSNLAEEGNGSQLTRLSPALIRALKNCKDLQLRATTRDGASTSTSEPLLPWLNFNSSSAQPPPLQTSAQPPSPPTPRSRPQPPSPRPSTSTQPPNEEPNSPSILDAPSLPSLMLEQNRLNVVIETQLELNAQQEEENQRLIELNAQQEVENQRLITERDSLRRQIEENQGALTTLQNQIVQDIEEKTAEQDRLQLAIQTLNSQIEAKTAGVEALRNEYRELIKSNINLQNRNYRLKKKYGKQQTTAAATTSTSDAAASTSALKRTYVLMDSNDEDSGSSDDFAPTKNQKLNERLNTLF